MNTVLSTAHSTTFHIEDNPMCHVQQENVTTELKLQANIPYRPSTGHVLHSFCLEDHNITHINMHYTHSITHPTAFHYPPMYTTNDICKM